LLHLPREQRPIWFTVATAQNYHAGSQLSLDGHDLHSTSTTNSVTATDVGPAASSEGYTSSDSDGVFYDCQIASVEQHFDLSQPWVPARRTLRRSRG
jgi:hypothetical protein